jgi:arylsulfatase A-like enzyme
MTQAKPNVLFIAIDDLRDWVGYLGNKQVKTPHLDRLAARGVAFTRSFCASPCCNPSRAALMTGLRPGTSGVYNNNDNWQKIVPEGTVTLQQHFRNNGYYAAGAGKIYHGGLNRLSDWDDYNTEGKARTKSGKFKEDGGAGVAGIRFGALDCSDEDECLQGQHHHLPLERPRLASRREAALAEVCVVGRGHPRALYVDRARPHQTRRRLQSHRGLHANLSDPLRPHRPAHPEASRGREHPQAA